MKIEIKMVGQIDPNNLPEVNSLLKEVLSHFKTYKFNFEENKGA